jgi:DNA/RNA-binding protein KIN17
MSDEQRERQLIAEQIEKAKVEKGEDADAESPPPDEARELKRDEGVEKVILSFAKPTVAPTAASSTSTSTGLKMNPLRAGGNPLKMGNPLKANPLKRSNVFKQASAGSSSSTVESTNDKKRSMSAAEALILEDQERKKRRL